jgi:hypothetical protein
MSDDWGDDRTGVSLSMKDEIIQSIGEDLAKLEAENAELRKDEQRMDWIDANMDCDLSGPGLSVRRVCIGDDQTLREAIDAAREASQ